MTRTFVTLALLVIVVVPAHADVEGIIFPDVFESSLFSAVQPPAEAPAPNPSGWGWHALLAFTDNLVGDVSFADPADVAVVDGFTRALKTKNVGMQGAFGIQRTYRFLTDSLRVGPAVAVTVGSGATENAIQGGAVGAAFELLDSDEPGQVSMLLFVGVHVRLKVWKLAPGWELDALAPGPEPFLFQREEAELMVAIGAGF